MPTITLGHAFKMHWRAGKMLVMTPSNALSCPANEARLMMLLLQLPIYIFSIIENWKLRANTGP